MVNVDAEKSQNPLVQQSIADPWRVTFNTPEVFVGIMEMPVFVTNTVAEEKGICPILLPNHRWTLCRIEDRVVFGVTVVEVVTVVERLAEVVHKFNWFLLRPRPLWNSEIGVLFFPNKNVMVVCAKKHRNAVQRFRITD